jgi:hypothetical protein
VPYPGAQIGSKADFVLYFWWRKNGQKKLRGGAANGSQWQHIFALSILVTEAPILV